MLNRFKILVIILSIYIPKSNANVLRDSIKVKRTYISISLFLNSLINKTDQYNNLYIPKSSDGYLQDVKITPQKNIGYGVGFSFNRKLKKHLHCGIVNEFHLYNERFQKLGIENDISYNIGIINQKSSYLTYHINAEFGIHLKLFKFNYLDLSTGIGLYSPFFTFGTKSFYSETYNYNHSEKWSYAQLDFFLYCPIKILFSRTINNREFGIGLKTMINDSYSIPNSNQNPDIPSYTNRNRHNIGFNGISAYSLKTHNDPSKTFLLNLIIDIKL
ncbi:MAG: hypothetical protein IT237_03840 [Bacteroidia bacterium]|nr:hypothetical protein [Bacteroidia bacterium]